MSDNQKKAYDADSIKVLRGLEPVKKRPGMYTRTDSPTHIIQEVIDNAADEALAGFATRVIVTARRDGSVEVEDDGRGIPVDIPSGEKVPAVELVFTQLHSGGKFDKEAGNAYQFSGGLHGVGVSVTNALSTRLEVEVKRNGNIHRLVFADGNREEKLSVIGTCAKKETGTRVRAWPDTKYFDSPNVSMPEIEHLVKSKAVLMPGVSMILRTESSPKAREEGAPEFIEKTWTYTGGLSQYLEDQINESGEQDELAESELPPIPVISGELYGENGEGANWAVSFRSGAGGRGESYVNLIPTLSGGTHESGFRNGIFEAIRSFAEHHALMPRGIKLSAEDAWNNVHFILSAKILDPQFQGQTKEKLTNRDALKMVSASVSPVLEAWLNQHPEMAKRIAEMAIKSAAARTRAMVKVEKRKTSGISVLPDKLSDCEMAGSMEAEIFLVEGDSAGGSAKNARDRERQAIMPLKGKIKNTWEVSSDVVLSFNEVHDLFQGLGLNPHSIGEPVDISGLRYGKICILADADVDGSHIQVLLLALFIKHAPAVIDAGRLYIAMPPLYRIDVPSRGKGKPEQKIYVSDDREKASVLDRLEKEGLNPDRIAVQRFKGLGEMNPEQLWETTLCPDTRRLVRVTMDMARLAETSAMFDMLMAKDESSSRREWMEANGHVVEADI